MKNTETTEKKSRILNAVGEINDEFILEAAPTGVHAKRSSRSFIVAAIGTAAAAAVALLAVFGGKGKPNAPIRQAQESEKPLVTETAPPVRQSPVKTPELANDDIEISSSFSYAAGYGLDMVISYAPVIFTGKCIDVKPMNPIGFIDASFSIISVLRCEVGEVKTQSTVTVRTYISQEFKEGEEYLVFSRPMASVYERIPLLYVADEYVAKSGYKGDMPDMRGKDYSTILEETIKRTAANPFKGKKSVQSEYCTSDDLAEILAFADCVVTVKADKIYENSVNDRTSYICSVLSVLKGDVKENNIDVVAFKDSMKLGDEYVLILTQHIDRDTVIYSMAAVNSLFEAGSAEAQQIKELLK